MQASINGFSSAAIGKERLLKAEIVRASNNIVSDMGEEKVILSIENGKYYNLGVMGGQIWDLIEAPVTVLQLIDMLTEQYEVERHTCEEQLIPFLLHMLDEGLIHLNE